MKFALVNEQKTEAQPKLKGLCPGCLQPVTAKCGTQKIWHWAHLTKKHATVDGNEKQNGTETGKINFPKNGRNTCNTTSQEKNISRMSAPLMDS